MVEPTTNPIDNPSRTDGQMKWASALSTRPSLEAALGEVVERAQQQLQAPADLGILFVSSTFASEYSRLMPLLQEKLQEKLPAIALFGCSSNGIVGMQQDGTPEEIEGKPAISLTLAHLPGVVAKVFHLGLDALPDLDSGPDRWTELIGVPSEAQPHFILLSSPFSSGITDLLQGLDFAYPAAVKIGGLAGGIMMIRLGINRSLWIFGFLQAASTACFALLARAGDSVPLLSFVIAFENLSSGMGTAAYAAFMASITNKKFTATQYALLTSLMGVPRVLASAPTGFHRSCR